MDVYLLLDPGGEVRHVAVNSRSKDFAEAYAAPRRQAEQRPSAAVLLAHQRPAAVALSTDTHTLISRRRCDLSKYMSDSW